MLRIQQGRTIIVGLRSEAVRIAQPSQAHAGEVVISGFVEHVEYQGHESLVHLNTGSRPAVVPELEAPRPAAPRVGNRRASSSSSGFGKFAQKAARRLQASVMDREGPTNGSGGGGVPPRPGHAPDHPAGSPETQTGDLVVRTGPDVRVRRGDRVPLLVDLEHLYVFDHEGNRICPAPTRQPHLE